MHSMSSINPTLTSTGRQKQVGSRPVSHMTITLSLSAEAMEQSDILGYQPPLPLRERETERDSERERERERETHRSLSSATSAVT